MSADRSQVQTDRLSISQSELSRLQRKRDRTMASLLKTHSSKLSKRALKVALGTHWLKSTSMAIRASRWTHLSNTWATCSEVTSNVDQWIRISLSLSSVRCSQLMVDAQIKPRKSLCYQSLFLIYRMTWSELVSSRLKSLQPRTQDSTVMAISTLIARLQPHRPKSTACRTPMTIRTLHRPSQAP